MLYFFIFLSTARLYSKIDRYYFRSAVRDQLVNRLLINNYSVKMRNKHAFHSLQWSRLSHSEFLFARECCESIERSYCGLSLISRDVYVTSAVAVIIRYYLPAQLT